MSNKKYFQKPLDKKLSHVIEECGEVLAAAGKIQRWGWSGSRKKPHFCRVCTNKVKGVK